MATGEYSGSTLYPASSNNYSVASRPASNPINKIIIHVTQGSWAGAINWFQDPKAQVSAHYTLRSSDGAVGQSVREKDIAWHAGTWSYNQTSIGIEHEGFVSDSSWFTDAMYRSSAQLTAHLCNKYGIPRDRTHMIGHDEVPDPYNQGQYGGAGHHTDPGSYWDWAKYVGYVEYYAGTTTPPPPPPKPRRRRRRRRSRYLSRRKLSPPPKPSNRLKSLYSRLGVLSRYVFAGVIRSSESNWLLLIGGVHSCCVVRCATCTGVLRRIRYVEGASQWVLVVAPAAG